MKIKEILPEYLTHLKILGRARHTLKGTKYDLRRFIRFLEEEKVDHIEALSSEVLTGYQQALVFSLTATGKPLSVRTRAQRLSVIKGFTRFLKEKDYLVYDPGEALQLPKKPRRLPKVILSSKEVKTMLGAQDMRTNRGYRNRILLEILYDTAIRRAEIAGIRLTDMDLDAGYIKIRGKRR